MTTRFRDPNGNPISATEYLATRAGARVPDRWIAQAEAEKAAAAKAEPITDADPGDENKED